MSTVDDLIRDYEPDVAWMTSLWLAIHGAKPGDKGHVDVRVDETTALLATALSARLSETYGLGPLTFEQLQERLRWAGIPVADAGDGSAPSPTPPDVNTIDTGAGPSGGRMIWHCYPTDDGWRCICVGREPN